MCLVQVRGDLEQVALACEGKLKLTNVVRDIMDTVNKGLVPMQWKRS